ncbi:MAG TPA: AEC family transporter [Ideonella sp.]|nr:AEC family transporter [Ideonella sp.]
MQAILAVTLPFFALVLGGYLAAQRGVLPASAIPGLNAFVLFFALPCMLFRFGQRTPVLELLNPVVLAVYLLAALAIVSFTLRATLSRRVHLKDAAFGALVAAFPNTGFMGVPLLVALFGPAAAGPVICTVLADMIVTSSLCLGLAQAHDASGQGWRVAAGRALRGALSNPLPWAIAAGAVAGATGLVLPGPVDTIVRMLGDAASPVALFTIGAVLWRANQHARLAAASPLASSAAAAASPRPSPPASESAPASSVSSSPMTTAAPARATPLALYLPVALIKLLLHPLVVWLLGLAAQRLGAPLSSFQLMVLTLAAALPSASNVSLLAERYGADNGRVARIILASTVLAFGSFTGLTWVFEAAR